MTTNVLPAEARAALFTAPGEPLTVGRFPLTPPTDFLAGVRVTCATLCGSDLHTYAGRRISPAPSVLGHEIIGRIASLPTGSAPCDADGEPLRPGDRVTWTIAASCGSCWFCTQHLTQKCERLFKYGHEAWENGGAWSGGLAEYVFLRAGTSVYRLPDSLPDTVACIANCAVATVCGLRRAAGGFAGKAVIVQGAGMLGLTACALAHSDGAAAVVCIEPSPERLPIARTFGASAAVATSEEAHAVIRAATEGRGADVLLELSGAVSAIENGLPLLRIGGLCLLAGTVSPTPPLPLFPEMVVRRMLTLRGIHNYAPEDLAAAVAFLTAHHARYPFAALIGPTFPLAEADAAFRYALTHRPLRIAVAG